MSFQLNLEEIHLRCLLAQLSSWTHGELAMAMRFLASGCQSWVERSKSDREQGGRATALPHTGSSECLGGHSTTQRRGGTSTPPCLPPAPWAHAPGAPSLITAPGIGVSWGSWTHLPSFGGPGRLEGVITRQPQALVQWECRCSGARSEQKICWGGGKGFALGRRGLAFQHSGAPNKPGLGGDMPHVAPKGALQPGPWRGCFREPARLLGGFDPTGIQIRNTCQLLVEL